MKQNWFFKKKSLKSTNFQATHYKENTNYQLLGTKWDITTDPADIKSCLTKENYKQLYTKKFESLDEIHQFL